ncbi:acyl-CoA dehydrogenase family protein [Streptomyces sp. NPDC059597]|uniref:acyl-CoA dehydrogenase family protein n=1 Tax=Streptomyces sp. NPDC059597 TaxID=3346879 RepID=UPI0036C31090
MQTTQSPYIRTEDFEAVLRDVVAPLADEVDRAGRFPGEGIRALGEAGLLGLLSLRESGGAGAGLREAAQVIERLAGACGSTAMVLLITTRPSPSSTGTPPTTSAARSPPAVT